MQKNRIYRSLLQVFAVSLITSGFVFCANAYERKTAIITFDVPGAGTGSGQGTFGFAISPEGTITGLYHDSDNVGHGYVRARDGTFIKFDAPARPAFLIAVPWVQRKNWTLFQLLNPPSEI